MSSGPTLPSSVDLRVVWGALGGFVFLSLLISGVSRVKWLRHRRSADLLASAAVDDDADADAVLASPSTAASSLTAFASALLTQRDFTTSLFARQQDGIRSQLDRLVAETEQVKALLAVRMSEDRGYVDAAIALLLAEMTAAASYRSRQRKREAEVETLQMQVVQQALDVTRDHPGAQGQAAVTLLKDRCALYSTLLSSAFKESERERQRIHHLSSSSSILGNEALGLLQAHVEDEADAERKLHRVLRAVLRHCDNFRFDCIDDEVEQQVGKAAGRGGRAASSSTLSRRLLQSGRRLHVELTRALDQWPALLAALAETRALRAADEAAALEALERQKARVDADQSKGIFAGLHPQLTESLTFFIQQAAKQAQESGFNRKGLGAGGRLLPAAATTAAAAATSSNNPSSSSSSTPSFLCSVLSSSPTAISALNSLAPPFAAIDGPILPSSSGSSGDEDAGRSASDLSLMYADWLARGRMRDELELAEWGRQMEVARQLDLHSASTALAPEDEQRLQAAQSEVVSLSSAHLRQLAAAADSGRVDEQKQAELVLKELKAKESSAAAREAELRADALARQSASRAGVGEGDEEGGEAHSAEASAELLLALQALHEGLHAERCQAQLELQAIHSRVDAKTRAAVTRLERQQKGEGAAALARYDAVKAEIDARGLTASSVQVEGVDLRHVRDEVERGGGSSAREEALKQFHAAALTELQRGHAQALRLLREERGGAHKEELQQRREDWEEAQRMEGEAVDAEWQVKVDAEADTTTVAALRAQQAEERRRRERRGREEWRRVEVELQAQHQRDDEAKVTELRQAQAEERAREVEEQSVELSDLRMAGQQQREEAALRSILSPSNRAQARQLISAITASRHAQQLQALLRAQLGTTKEETQRRLDAEQAELSQQRDDIHHMQRQGQLTADEAAERLAALTTAYAPSVVSGRVYAEVSAASSAALERLKREQLEEQKALMRSVFPDEAFTSADWADQPLDLSAIAALHTQQTAAHQAQLQQELTRLDQAEQAQVSRALHDRQTRVAELEDRLRVDNQLVRAQFAAQLRVVTAEYEERVRAMQAELEVARGQARSEEERVRVEADAAALMEEERAAHAALLASAEAQLEAELEVRNEGERVQMRRELDEEVTSTMKEARKAKEERRRERMREEEATANATRNATEEAVLTLIDRGRRFRRTRQRGTRLAVQQLMKQLTHTSPTSAAVAPTPEASTSSPAPPGGAASAQLAAIERLLLRLQPAGTKGGRGESADSIAAQTPTAVPVAIPAAELGPRAVATSLAVQRLLQALQPALQSSPSGGQLTIRMTRAQSPVADAATTALPPSGLPSPHLCTADANRRVLWLWWDERRPLSSYLLSAFYRLVSFSASDGSTDSLSFQLRLNTALSTLLHRTLATSTPVQAVDEMLSEVPSAAGVAGGEAAAADVVDELTARLYERLQRGAEAKDAQGEGAGYDKRKEREEVQQLMARIARAERGTITVV